jgi:hypothetical protein
MGEKLPYQHVLDALMHIKGDLEQANNWLEQTSELQNINAINQIAHALGVIEGLRMYLRAEGFDGESTPGT